ncbi:MAG: ubiquitin-like domain-containing protein [Actinomycetota bacterium]
MRTRYARRRPRAPVRWGRSWIPALALCLVVGSVGYLQLDRKVTLVVDGQARILHVFGGTVGELLEGAGITVGPHDKLSPGLDTALTDGMRVRYLKAKEITLVLNGRSRTIYVAGTKVRNVLQTINVRAGRNAYVSRSRDARIFDGDIIEFRPAVQVQLQVGGTPASRIITNAPTVGYLLDSLGVILRSHDHVKPQAKKPLTNGMLVSVTRIRFAEILEREIIPFTSETQYSDEMPRGHSEIVRYGVEGIRNKKFFVRFVNGVEAHRRLLKERLVRSPVGQIEVVGTRDPYVEEGYASWYARNGLVAAHKTIPKWTRVKVTNLANGKSCYVTIDDRGPYVEGRIIDLSDDAFEKLAPLGEGTIRVRISW